VDSQGTLIGEGHNRVRADVDPTAHGEIVAIRAASRRLGAWSALAGGTLYSSCEPCLVCSFVITQIGLKRVVFAAWVNAQPDWSKLQVVGDFMRDRALRIIAAFPWAQARTRTAAEGSS